MSECLQILEQERESPLDAVLVQQAKICRVVEKANAALVSGILSSEELASWMGN